MIAVKSDNGTLVTPTWPLDFTLQIAAREIRAEVLSQHIGQPSIGGDNAVMPAEFVGVGVGNPGMSRSDRDATFASH